MCIRDRLDTVASPTAEANGGYTAIRNPNGQYVNIEDILGKPLNEVVAGDVLQLINEGYTNIGRYDITPEAYMSIFLSNGLTGDIPFDEKGQDLVVLSRLRQKAQAANSYAVLNSRYRRLVNIPEEDHQRFLETVGELPTWLRLDTLLPEAAKELVNITLGNEEAMAPYLEKDFRGINPAGTYKKDLPKDVLLREKIQEKRKQDLPYGAI